MSLELWSLGVGDAFTARYWSTCALLDAHTEVGRLRLLIDCPHPIRRVLGEQGLDVGDVDAVVITHCHADHVSGLEGLLFYAYFVLRRRLPVLAHPEVLEALWGGHLRAGMSRLLHVRDGALHPEDHELTDYAEVVPLSASAPTAFRGLSIECRRTIHHVPTTALRFRTATASLGWSADTAFDPGLVAWLAAADRFVHETNHGAHTPYAALAALPAEVRRKMWLVHYPDEFDVDASGIPCLRQGTRYPIRPPTS
jgi:ribonuclease BN (tRNA processing enzyme)